MPLMLLFVALLVVPAAVATDEWPGLRGPHHDGSAARGSLFRGAEGDALVVAWRATLGPGYSGVVVAEGLAVTVFSNGAEDIFVAFDSATGRERWRHALAPTHKGIDGSFDGPIATPAVADGRAFAFGPFGHLLAVELHTGRVLWRTDPPKELGADMPFYGFGSSPLVASGVLVVPVGGSGARAIAGFDPATGRRLFLLGDDSVTYQSPVVMWVGAEEHVVAVGDTKLFGIDPRGGRLLWDHLHGGDGGDIGAGSLVPVPAGEGRLFVKDGVNRTTMLRVQARAEGGYAVETLWTAPVLRSTYVIPVYHEGHLYGMNGRTVLTCVDAATGELRWRSREPGEGFPILVGGDLVVLTKERTLHVGPASPLGWQEQARLELFQDLVWTQPSFAGGAVFARSQGEIARVEWGRPEGRAASAPAAATVSAPPSSPAPPLSARSPFAAFRAEVEAAPDKTKVVDQFLASVPSFPLVEGRDRVVFLYRGDATDMAIVGDLQGERREDPMTRLPGTDLFYYEARLEPDMRVSYEFVRNFEERLLDPRNPRRAAQSRIQPVAGRRKGEVSFLTMPEWQAPPALAAPPEERRGRLETHEVSSTSRPGVKVALHVYLPAGYDGRAHLPTAYVFGGDLAREVGQVPDLLDRLLGSRVEPLLAAFIGRIDWGGAGPAYGKEEQATAEIVARDVVAFVDARYPTRKDRAARAAVGTDLDAVAAAFAAFSHPTLFGGLGTHSMSLEDPWETELRQHVRTAASLPLRLYLDWARYDARATREAWDARRSAERFVPFLRERGYRPAGGEAPDGAGWASWRNRTDRLFEELFPARVRAGSD